MKLPYSSAASIPKAKVVDYLLSSTHVRGKGKAAFFMRHGFSGDEWMEFAKALRQHALDHEITAQEGSPFGDRCVIDGTLRSPHGDILLVRTVWFIDTGKEVPRFVTAYPLKHKSHDPGT